MARSALALLLAAACATPSQPFEGHPVLASIDFEGNDHISKGELLSKIASAPVSGFFTKTAHYYDADLFAIDLKRIERWYNEKGFYEAKVKDVQELRDAEGRVSLLVKIDEGRRASVIKIDIQGVEDLRRSEQNRLRSSLPLKVGDGFDEDVYDKSKDVLQEQLQQMGFAQADVTAHVEVAPEAGTAQIAYQCDTGQRFSFGKVIVTGNRAISTSEIIQATGIERGDPYSPVALVLAQQRVYNLGVFSGVRVSLEPLGDSPVAAVRVNVREAPFQTVRFGAGAAIEQTRWELPRLHGEYINRSLFGHLRRLELEGNVGYAFVEAPWDYDASRSGVATRDSAQLVVPNIILPGLDWITRGEFEREVQSSFAYDEVAARVSLVYRRGRHALAPSLNFVRYFNVTLRGAALSDILATGGSSAGIVNECPTSCTLTYPEIRYTFDGRDNAIEPTRGIYTTISLQQTLKPGSFNYFRINPDLRLYFPMAKFAVVALRVDYGALATEGDSASPFPQRFFFGGQNEQRGYSALRQGPKLGAQPTCAAIPSSAPTLVPCNGATPYATSAVPVGGTHAILFSGEIRWRAEFLLKNLGVVTFVDASRVQDTKNPLEGGLEFAPGLGLRYLTGFGPIRLDVAWLANPKDVYTQPVTGVDPNTGKTVTAVATTRVSSSCNGAPNCIDESRWSFHITLGEAF